MIPDLGYKAAGSTRLCARREDSTAGERDIGMINSDIDRDCDSDIDIDGDVYVV